MSSEKDASSPTNNPQSAHHFFAYHEFGDGSSQDVYQLTPAAFRSHLVLLGHVHLKQQINVQITFDDAHVSQVEIAVPLMEEFALRGMFFVPASWVGAGHHRCSWEQLRRLIKKGHIIGSHGLTHALLTSLNTTDLTTELVRSRSILEENLGVPVDSISMPGGRWNRQIAAACFDAGYRELYTSDPVAAVVSIPYRDVDARRIIGRLAVRRNMSMTTLEHYISGSSLISARLRCEYQVKQALKNILGDSYYQTLWRRMLRSPVSSHEQT